MRGPAALAADEDALGVVADDGHDDGGVGAWEAEVRDPNAGHAGGAVARCLGACGALSGSG